MWRRENSWLYRNSNSNPPVIQPIARRNTDYAILAPIMPSSTLKVHWLFGGTCRLHLQGQRISQARNQHEAGSKKCSASQRPWRWRWHVPLECLLTFNGLHGITHTAQKIELWNLPCSNFWRGPRENSFRQSLQWISWLCKLTILPSQPSCHRASSHSTDELQLEFQLWNQPYTYILGLFI
jgi:hypothetical protein